MIAATIVVMNTLPALILWKAPGARGWVYPTVWIIISTIVTAMHAITTGVVIVNREATSFWAPWQAVISVIINLIVVIGFLCILRHLPD